jgi:hypothetical protein
MGELLLIRIIDDRLCSRGLIGGTYCFVMKFSGLANVS